MVGDFTIYPREYFSPQHYRTGKLEITPKHTVYIIILPVGTHTMKNLQIKCHIS